MKPRTSHKPRRKRSSDVVLKHVKAKGSLENSFCEIEEENPSVNETLYMSSDDGQTYLKSPSRIKSRRISSNSKNSTTQSTAESGGQTIHPFVIGNDFVKSNTPCKL